MKTINVVAGIIKKDNKIFILPYLGILFLGTLELLLQHKNTR